MQVGADCTEIDFLRRVPFGTHDRVGGHRYKTHDSDRWTMSGFAPCKASSDMTFGELLIGRHDSRLMNSVGIVMRRGS
jgi:hypothetical protein